MHRRNLYTVETCSEKTNFDESCETGTEFMLEFQRSLPEEF